MRSHALIQFIMLSAIGVLISGCSWTTATPVRTTADFGQSVRNMVSQSIYDPKTSEHPDRYAPDGMEGQKASVALQRAYQGDIGSAARVRAAPQLNISNSGGASAMGGTP